jgi:hypothetical protein
MTLATPPPARAPLDREAGLDDGEPTDEAQFRALLHRLSQQSVTKHYDAYADIPWDAPDFAIDPTDPRFIIEPTHPLAATTWYRAQPIEMQARIGLFGLATSMKRGVEFENVLKRGLLTYAFEHLRNDDPRFRYVYHEVAEETHHGMMFQEFINRSGMNPAPMHRLLRFGSRDIVNLGRRFPPLFFFYVLGGEDPIDQVQRSVLRSDHELHPLTEMIMRHHVTEEARHISFARYYLKVEVPRLRPAARAWLVYFTPFLLGMMADMMLVPAPELRTRFGAPREVLREAKRSPLARRRKVESVAKIRRLCRELGLITPFSKQLWRAFGVWADDPAPAAPGT